MASDTTWRDTFELAARDPHFRILHAAFPGRWFEQGDAAAANESTKQSISRPLKALEDHGLIHRRRRRRRDEFRLTRDGEAVREVLLRGPLLRQGSWWLAVRIGKSGATSLTELLKRQQKASVARCSGGYDYLIIYPPKPEHDDLVAELKNELIALGAETSETTHVVRYIARRSAE